jgi:hypothetical protein
VRTGRRTRTAFRGSANAPLDTAAGRVMAGGSSASLALTLGSAGRRTVPHTVLLAMFFQGKKTGGTGTFGNGVE